MTDRMSVLSGPIGTIVQSVQQYLGARADRIRIRYDDFFNNPTVFFTYGEKTASFRVDWAWLHEAHPLEIVNEAKRIADTLRPELGLDFDQDYISQLEAVGWI